MKQQGIYKSFIFIVMLIFGYGLVCSTTAQALGLGNLTNHSILNQRVIATIDLTGTENIALAQIRVDSAPEALYQRVNLPFTPFVNKLQYTVMQTEEGRPIIKIASLDPITDPSLIFLVEVKWPNGNLVRQYTLLPDLTPPNTSSQATITANPAAVKPLSDTVDVNSQFLDFKLNTRPVQSMSSANFSSVPKNDVSLSAAHKQIVRKAHNNMVKQVSLLRFMWPYIVILLIIGTGFIAWRRWRSYQFNTQDMFVASHNSAKNLFQAACSKIQDNYSMLKFISPAKFKQVDEYMQQGDFELARDILEEIYITGNFFERQKARILLSKLSLETVVEH